MNQNFSFGLLFGGVTGIIAAFILTVIIMMLYAMWKEEEKKKKHNYVIHFTAINIKTNERLEDTATVIGAESEDEALEMLKNYINTVSKNPTIDQVEWIIEKRPQFINWKDQTVFSYRYYG